MNSYIIPNEMARQLAVALYSGIVEYIQTHQEKYMQFLKEAIERKENEQNDNGVIRYEKNRNYPRGTAK